jgi:hypothetical protein
MGDSLHMLARRPHQLPRRVMVGTALDDCLLWENAKRMPQSSGRPWSARFIVHGAKGSLAEARQVAVWMEVCDAHVRIDTDAPGGSRQLTMVVSSIPPRSASADK